MKFKELFSAQLEREMPATRNALLRVPEGRNDWKPHDKSMSLGQLATLVATMPSWLEVMIEQDELDFMAPDSKKYSHEPPATNAELVKKFDECVAKARKALAATNDEHLMKKWVMRAGEHVISDRPRHIAIADDMFCHFAHHRGQLTVYLRLNDASVPAIYGPTADEGKM